MTSAFRWTIAAALLILCTIGALAPIRNYNAFWHLATGRWIVEHRALPQDDPFAVASDRGPWINGEWLFEVALRGIEEIAGIDAVCVARALFVGALFALGFLFASRRANGWLALLATAAAFAGGVSRLDVRPSSAAALLLVVAIALLERDDEWGTERLRRDLSYAALTGLWINVHPSALLAPVIAAVAVIVRRLSMTDRSRDASLLIADARLVLLSFAALFVNPFGWRGVVAPIELSRYASSGAFVNAEWLWSPPAIFPLLYLTVIGGLAMFAAGRNRRELWRFALMLLFAFLAIRYARNQSLWFAAFPLLAAPLAVREKNVADARAMRSGSPWRAVAAVLALLFIGIPLATGEHHLGIDRRIFPVDAIAPMRALGMRGNIYNPDQFGGFLIWSFYPDRRVLVDGRNELYHAFIPEYAEARLDGRKWNALLRNYRIDLAVDEYRSAPIDVIDGATRQHHLVPASLVYFPRRQWALIGYDAAGMAFARRAAFTPELLSHIELRDVVPDDAAHLMRR